MKSNGRIRRKRRTRRKSFRRFRVFLLSLGTAGIVVGAVLVCVGWLLHHGVLLIVSGGYIALSLATLAAAAYMSRRAEERRSTHLKVVPVRPTAARERSGETRP